MPRSAGEVEEYFARMRPQLRATEPAFEAVRFLRHFGENVEQKIMVRILMNGAVGVLPGWARDGLGIRRPRVVRELIDKPLMRVTGRLLRWACEPSPIVAAANERMTKSSASAV